MNLIVCADENWGIGSRNQLLVRIPDDMRYFREITMGKAVVMGRKTKESLPNGFLDGRDNLVLTHDMQYQAGNAAVLHSLKELRDRLAQYDSDAVFVIGGESVYRQLLGVCDTAYVTKLAFAYSADAYFPNLDQMEEWELVGESEEQTYFDIIYYFRKYKKKQGYKADWEAIIK